MSTYLIFKSVHMLGIVLFLGNIIVTGWWKYMADRHGNPIVVAFAQRQVILTDYVFTLGGVVLVLIGGTGMAAIADLRDTFWVSLGMGMFVASGVIWVAILLPVQIKQSRLAKSFQANSIIPADYKRLNQQWMFWGALATLLPLSNLIIMVFKPTGV